MKHIRGTWLHRRLGDRLFSIEMWQPERFRFASGFSIGVFFGMLPIPIQMLSAALIAYLTRVNIPAAVAGTWMSNPLTMPFLLYLQYRFGSFLLGSPEIDISNLDWIALLKRAPLEFLVGGFVNGCIFSLLSYPVCLKGWDFVTKHFLEPKRRPFKKPPAVSKPADG